MTKVAITGSEGFIGRNLVRRLLPNFRVIGMDKDGNPLHKGNLLNEDWPLQKADVLVHLAAIPSVFTPPDEREALIAHNLMLTKRALWWAKSSGVELMINASSSSVYGDRLVPPFREDDFCQPMNAYGVSKLRSEQWLTENAEKHGVKVLSMRLFNVLGRYQRPTMFPWLALESARERTVLPIYGMRHRAWTSVEDVTAVMHEAIMHPTSFPAGHTIVNVGLNKAITQRDFLIDLNTAYYTAFEEELPLKTEEHPPRDYEMPITEPATRLYHQFFAHRISEDAYRLALIDLVRYHREIKGWM